MRLVIKERDVEAGREVVVAVIENWQGPIPQEGDAIVHPPLRNDDAAGQQWPACNVMIVKSLKPLWNIITRPEGEPGDETRPKHFVGHLDPSVEIWV